MPMMQEDLIETVASHRAKEIERERQGTKAEVEAQPYKYRAVIHLTRDGVPIGVEFIESEASINHPAVDKEYLRFIRDDLYMGIGIPQLSHELEKDLVVRLKAIREHVRQEGYVITQHTVLYVYDDQGNIERKMIRLLE